ncbi:DMT family transporter [Risungbinella massiliensis]|uniref:DMT family transporter n=1 Tax=Risungbinella massiliensis TaxID=1329796 RepID=UPI0005CC272A|nr:multidrug efflux SMR transporter [Risungbinella massiliensis]
MEKQTSNAAWGIILIAGVLEIGWAIGLKSSHGFTELIPSLVVLVLLPISFYLFAKALKILPIGTAYTVFTGIGSAGTVIYEILFMEEPASIGKITFLVILLIGVIGLKLSDKGKEESHSIERGTH